MSKLEIVPNRKLSFDEKMAKLADKLIDRVIDEDLYLEQQVLAFKELRAYYAMMKKQKPEDDTPAFNGFSARIEALEKE